jgi:hypothetical protein
MELFSFLPTFFFIFSVLRNENTIYFPNSIKDSSSKRKGLIFLFIYVLVTKISSIVVNDNFLQAIDISFKDSKTESLKRI